MCENATFLGIRFDKQLSFKNQLSYLNEACLKRLNIIKVLSKKKLGYLTKNSYPSLQLANKIVTRIFKYYLSSFLNNQSRCS